jgi:hypothetical protein
LDEHQPPAEKKQRECDTPRNNRISQPKTVGKEMQCFHQSFPQVVRANPERSRFPVREESQVAWLESPNGLGALSDLAGFPRTVSILFFGGNGKILNRRLRGFRLYGPDC